MLPISGTLLCCRARVAADVPCLAAETPAVAQPPGQLHTQKFTTQPYRRAATKRGHDAIGASVVRTPTPTCSLASATSSMLRLTATIWPKALPLSARHPQRTC
jgi:hypothetical protein